MVRSPVVLDAGFGRGKPGEVNLTTFVPVPGFAGSMV